MISFIRNELFDSLPTDLDDLFPYIISIVFCLVGFYAFSHNVSWLLILSAVVAFITRTFMLIVNAVNEDKSFRGFLNSTKVLLIVTVAGYFLVNHFWKLSFFHAVALSLNASMLFIYILNILLVVIPIMIRNTVKHCRYELSCRREKMNAIKTALKAAKLEKHEVKNLQIELRIDGDYESFDFENMKFYYEVTFTHGNQKYCYKIYQ